MLYKYLSQIHSCSWHNSCSIIKLHFSSAPLQQLRANIREMEKLCSRVRAEDAAALEALVKPVRDRASAAAQDFLLLHANPAPQPTPAPPPAAQASSCASSGSNTLDDVGEEQVSGRQIQLHLPEIPHDQSAAESWDNLEEVCTAKWFVNIFLTLIKISCLDFFFSFIALNVFRDINMLDLDPVAFLHWR